MDRIECFRVFLEVARLGSFAQAARTLNISASSVTKHVAALEKALGARLLNRTTRSMSLTESGLLAMKNGRQLVERMEQLESRLRQTRDEVRGVIRLGAPPSFGALQLVDLLQAFLTLHPQVQVVMSIDAGDNNSIAAGLDATIRIGHQMEDSSNIAVPLTQAPQVLVAAPSYLKQYGTPKTLKDLSRHNCLVHSVKSPFSTWRFTGPEREVAVRVSGNLIADYAEPLRESAIRGYGISIHPYYAVSEDLAAGRLVKLLPQFEPERTDLVLLYSSREHLPQRVRQLIEFLRDWARTPPPWSQSPLAA